MNEEPTVGEEAYVWFGSVFPLACDVVNARFTFEALTATTANRLHYPAYDRFLKEMDKYAACSMIAPKILHLSALSLDVLMSITNSKYVLMSITNSKFFSRSFKFFQDLPTPTGVEFAEDEFILHMEGTAGTQRVVRHIGTTSWPGNHCEL